jgi:hypothetical protein
MLLSSFVVSTREVHNMTTGKVVPGPLHVALLVAIGLLPNSSSLALQSFLKLPAGKHPTRATREFLALARPLRQRGFVDYHSSKGWWLTPKAEALLMALDGVRKWAVVARETADHSDVGRVQGVTVNGTTLTIAVTWLACDGDGGGHSPVTFTVDLSSALGFDVNKDGSIEVVLPESGGNISILTLATAVSTMGSELLFISDYVPAA